MYYELRPGVLNSEFHALSNLLFVLFMLNNSLKLIKWATSILLFLLTGCNVDNQQPYAVRPSDGVPWISNGLKTELIFQTGFGRFQNPHGYRPFPFDLNRTKTHHQSSRYHPCNPIKPDMTGFWNESRRLQQIRSCLLLSLR